MTTDETTQHQSCRCPRCRPGAHVHHCGRLNCGGECRGRDDADTLHLAADSLLSKYGFDDGSIPEQVLDYLDALGIPYPENWHSILTALVREYLLPELGRHHNVVVEEIVTSHNPIRARVIDGVPVTTAARFTLTPPYVLVPMDAVVSCMAVRDRTSS